MRYDVIIIGGGLAGLTAGVEILRAGRTCCCVSEGLSLHQVPIAEYIALGGVYLCGDSAADSEWDGDVLKCIYTRNLEGTRLEAEHFILATGKFFSRGLVSDMDGIREPLFGADVEYEPDMDKWYDNDFYAPQPFESFGVRTFEGRVLIGGVPSANLYAAGEILPGNVDITKSALEVCRRIL